MGRKLAIRLMAFLLLFVMGGDAVACEFLSHDHFESFRVPSDDMRHHQSHDHCICCCTHVVVAAPITVPEPTGLVELLAYIEPGRAMRTPASIYHPPRV